MLGKILCLQERYIWLLECNIFSSDVFLDHNNELFNNSCKTINRQFGFECPEDPSTAPECGERYGSTGLSRNKQRPVNATDCTCYSCKSCDSKLSLLKTTFVYRWSGVRAKRAGVRLIERFKKYDYYNRDINRPYLKLFLRYQQLYSLISHFQCRSTIIYCLGLLIKEFHVFSEVNLVYFT